MLATVTTEDLLATIQRDAKDAETLAAAQEYLRRCGGSDCWAEKARSIVNRSQLPALKLERGRVVNHGMGGFLNPPAHPEHNFSVEVDLRRRPENRGGMSLSSAAECAHLDLATRRAARTVLAGWSRPAIDSAEVKAWISQVLGYFANCYQNTAAGDECWHAGKLLIDKTRNPLDTPDQHAGVHLIRRYYPEYQPKAEDFASAKWGN